MLRGGAAGECVCYQRALMARGEGRGVHGCAQRAAGRRVCGAHSTPGRGGPVLQQEQSAAWRNQQYGMQRLRC